MLHGMRGMAKDKNIVLMGFMGTGKSTVGEIVAARLGRPFVDFDARIVDVSGKSIAEIFAENGEEGFRRWEGRISCASACTEGQVLATGGGIVLDPENVRALSRRGILICLEASIESIVERVSKDGGRPLLNSKDRWQRIRDLLEERRPLYEALPYHINTEGMSAEAVADRVIEISSSQAE